MSDLPKEVSIDLGDGISMDFCRIVDHGELANFRMGAYAHSFDEELVHRVVIHQPYYLAKYPVTQAQYAILVNLAGMELNPKPSHFEGKRNHPEDQVSWDDCQRLLGGLNQKVCFGEQLPQGFVADLPSEAQWEYACRGGTETEYWSGDGKAALEDVGWFDQNSGGSTSPVGLKLPNGHGLHDMHGNVWEWCADVWDAHAYAKRADGWTAGVWTEVDAGADVDRDSDSYAYRVIRGGSFDFPAFRCRSGSRYGRWPGIRNRNRGFRVALLPGSGGLQASQGADASGGAASERGTSRAADPPEAGASAVHLQQETFKF